MTVRINGQTYYRTSEACRRAGISKATLFRWISVGILDDTPVKDRNGWRLFSNSDIAKIKTEATRTSMNDMILADSSEQEKHQGGGG